MNKDKSEMEDALKGLKMLEIVFLEQKSSFRVF
jgi:hypothetical protein